MDKKLIKYVLIIIAILFLIILFILLNNALSGGKSKKLSYYEIEDEMVSATYSYLKTENQFPEFGDELIVTTRMLINKGYMKELSDYTDDTENCSGEVVVNKIDDEKYNYIPSLTCRNYDTKTLSSAVIDDNLTTVGSGLYQQKGADYEYIFRGDEVNNYVVIGKNYWRIVSIDMDGNLLLVSSSLLNNNYSWDNRYNDVEKGIYGINDYETNGFKSNAYKVLNGLYDNIGKTKFVNGTVLDEELKHLMIPYNLCVGSRNNNDTDFSGKIECGKIKENQYFGLLPVNYYVEASLDPKCDSLLSKNCWNYNYISNLGYSWWTMTPNNDSTYKAYRISDKTVFISECKEPFYYRLAIKVDSRALYNSGVGTKEDPYTVVVYKY